MDETKRQVLKALLATGGLSLATNPQTILKQLSLLDTHTAATTSTQTDKQLTASTQVSSVIDIDWYAAIGITIETGLSLIPEVGSILSGIVQILWPPSDQDIWGQIKAQVEQLINQKLDALVYKQVQASLTGLKNNLQNYSLALQNSKGNPTYISETWNIARGDFDQQRPLFQLDGYELLLLPLFAQFVNLELTLLRDGALFGASWGWTPEVVNNILDTIPKRIKQYREYTDTVYQQGYQTVTKNTPTNYHLCQPFYSVNTYVRQMALTVYDFYYFWPYFDPTATPPGSVAVLPPPREIYSDPVGTCDSSGAIRLPGAPTQPLSQLAVWAYDRIDAVQLLYPTGGGPGGETQSPRMGNSGGGSNQPPYGGIFNLSTNNPITVASGLSGDVLNSFTFYFQDGSSTGKLGGKVSGGSPYSFSYKGEIMSSIHINGVSSYYRSADSAVFGFQYPLQNQERIISGLKYLYIGSSSNATVVDLARRLVKPVSLNQLIIQATTENWDGQRQAYQTKLEASVKH